jgi:hypothetical protein
MCFKLLIIIGAYIFAIFGGVPLVGIFLKKFDLSQTNSEESKGLPGAGRMIGMVERGIILTFILFGDLTSISFIFVAKSMARFKQLENRHFAEYYLIGTLLSFFFAIIVALIAQALVGGAQFLEGVEFNFS